VFAVVQRGGHWDSLAALRTRWRENKHRDSAIEPSNRNDARPDADGWRLPMLTPELITPTHPLAKMTEGGSGCRSLPEPREQVNENIDHPHHERYGEQVSPKCN
jgi:hypothetical protein